MTRRIDLATPEQIARLAAWNHDTLAVFAAELRNENERLRRQINELLETAREAVK